MSIGRVPCRDKRSICAATQTSGASRVAGFSVKLNREWSLFALANLKPGRAPNQTVIESSLDAALNGTSPARKLKLCESDRTAGIPASRSEAAGPSSTQSRPFSGASWLSNANVRDWVVSRQAVFGGLAIIIAARLVERGRSGMHWLCWLTAEQRRP